MRRSGIIVAAGALLAFGSAAAQDAPARDRPGDPFEGRIIAERWCANCHSIGPGSVGLEIAPPFAGIAEMRSEAPEWLRVWLSTPHAGMPDLNLSRQEIADVIAYLQTLEPQGDENADGRGVRG